MKKGTRVADEIGQSKPFRSEGQEALVSLMRTADEVRRFLTGRLADEDVTLQQYNVLRILRGAGGEGLPTLEIGRRMIERQPGVTRLVDRLIRKGLVDRARDRDDRRKVVCTITPAGLSLLSRLDVRIDRTDETVAEVLDTAEVRTLIDLLDRLRAGVREP